MFQELNWILDSTEHTIQGILFSVHPLTKSRFCTEYICMPTSDYDESWFDSFAKSKSGDYDLSKTFIAQLL